jgi:predicted DNA-binding helix-hairpin-helix protein
MMTRKEITDKLTVDYYSKQIADEEAWTSSIISDPDLSDEEIIDILKQHIINWAACYVHGANLAGALYTIAQLENQLKHSHNL